MLRLPLLALLFALPVLAQPAPRNWANATCEDDLDSCQESCTIADGTSFNREGKLQRCSERCQEESQRCVFKRFQARRALEAPKPAPAPLPAPAERPAPPVPASLPSSTGPATLPSEAPPTIAPARSVAPPAGTPNMPALQTAMPLPQPMAPTLRPFAPPKTSWRASRKTARTPPLPPAQPPSQDVQAASGVTPAPPPAHASAPQQAGAPAPGDDSVDALLDSHASDRSAGSLQVQPTPSRAKSPSKLNPQKKDLSQWDPDALK